MKSYKSIYLALWLLQDWKLGFICFGNSSCVNLCPSVKTLEEMKDQWHRFGAGFEAFSLWISEKEKQLDAMKCSALALEEQIKNIRVQYCSL